MDFPFLEELNDVLSRFQEAGLSKKWKMDMQKKEEQYYKPLGGNKSEVLKAYSMNDLWFAFVLLFVGYTMSIILLIFEFVWEKIKNKII